VSAVFSVLTPTGRGAVAVVAVASSRATDAVAYYFRANNGRSLAEQRIAAIVYGRWNSDGEDLVVCRRTEELVEIHCHGGSQSVVAIAADLTAQGCEQIPWQDWLARQDDDALKVEAQIALAQATSTRTALILLEQYRGALRQELQAIYNLLLNSDATAEQRLAVLLATAELGMHLTRPWQVVIAGRPNVGKSSLINALVGYRRAIVFDQPGTTRDVVTAATVIEGWPVVLSDTAGMHEASDQIETAGIELAKQRLKNADLVVWVFDAAESQALSYQDLMMQEVNGLGLQLPGKQLLVLNKIDRVSDPNLSGELLATSATTGEGVDSLLIAIANSLVPEVPASGSAVLFTERQEQAMRAGLEFCRAGETARGAEMLAKLLESAPCGK
jgi:tRNA modification GTPase